MKSQINLKLIICFFCFANLVVHHGIAQEEGDSSQAKDDQVNETVQLLYETKPHKYITGAVSSISGDKISNIPGSNRLNSLTGLIPGFYVTNTTGLPGYENSTIRIRGFHTFGANRYPLVLIDGRIGDTDMLDPYDIESVSILKDASASILYGLRSANGIVLISTKKGKQGKVSVQVNTETSFSQPTRMPKFLDAYHYATLYNEAMLNDDPNATVRYDETALEAYRTGSDPYRYPNVNWPKEFLKDYSILNRNNINISGGSKTAQYYVSANYLYNSGLFNVDKDVNTYNTNTNISVMNVHGNVRLNISNNLSVFADIRVKKDKRNAPGGYSTNYDEGLFRSLYGTPFNAHPIKNADGSIAGTLDYTQNPYGLLNYNGYSVWERTSLFTFVELAYDLGSWIKGLKLKGNFGYNNYNDYYINRTKDFAVYQLNADDETYTKIGQDTQISNAGSYERVNGLYDHSLSLNYTAEFDKHHLDLMLMYDRQQIDNARSTNLTSNFQGTKGSLSYRFNNTYLFDFAASYQGNEQYPKNKRYGFFPAVSAGWIVSNEKFLQKVDFIDFLKIRGSYGRTGSHVGTYFDYLESFAAGPNVRFGTNAANQPSFYKNRIENPLLTWEKSTKTNGGIDLVLFHNRFSASFDYFYEKNTDILLQNAITAMYGADIYAPEGKFENKGFEFQIGWQDKIQDFEYFLNVNYVDAKNKIVYQNEQFRNYPWMYRTGNPLNTRFGYVFDRFFTEEDDFSALPDQSLLGTPQPGDLKYKDLNNDNVIDDNDVARIGYAKMPEIDYGINFGFKYKGLDMNVLFHGSANGSIYKQGYTYWDFYGKTGNVLEHHLERWQSGDGQSAGYPRLTISNTNNYATSSYWVQDNSFLRLKYIEIGYTLPTKISGKVGMSKARIFVNGHNLYSWDDVGFQDPELQDDGLAYPIQRTFSAGLNISF